MPACRLRQIRRSLLRIEALPGDPRGNALRAGLSVIAPLGVLLIVDRPEWVVPTVLGSLVSVYGRHHRRAARAAMQATWGVALASAAALGTAIATFPESPWLMVGATVLLAGLGGVLSDVLDAHPPGPLFLVFCVGVTATRPPGELEPSIAGLLVLGAAGFALVLGLLGPSGERNTAHGGHPGRHHVVRSLRPGAVLACVPRYALAAGAAGSIAVAAGLGHAYWATMAAVVPMSAPDTSARLARGAHRVAGTAVGLLLAGSLLALPGGPVVDLVLVAALQATAELLILRHYGSAIVFVTPFAILVGQLGREPAIMPLLRDRLLETVVGVGVAFVALGLMHRRRLRTPLCISAHTPCRDGSCVRSPHLDDGRAPVATVSPTNRTTEESS